MYTLALSTTFVLGAWGHGRLDIPATRKPLGFENEPLAGPNETEFVCRNDPNSNPKTKVTAGQSLNMQWTLTAKHWGDCSVYISYSDAAVNGVGDEKRAAKFFKIANVPDCRQYSGQEYAIDLPGWLPAGQAVIRWEWYALHMHPAIEFYVQCADVVIESDSTLTVDQLPSYPVVGPPVLPTSANVAPGYRHVFTATEQYYTGPPCAFEDQASDRNNCQLTAPGTTGYVDVSDRISGEQAPLPTPSPTEGATDAPTDVPSTDLPATPSPTESATDAPTDAPSTPAPTPNAGSCSNRAWGPCGGSSNPTAPSCCPSGYTCQVQNEWYSQCRNDGCPSGWDCESKNSDSMSARRLERRLRALESAH